MPLAVFGASCVPSGTHMMVLVSIDEVVGKFQDPAIRWVFEAMDGEWAGRQAKRTTGSTFAADTTAGRLLCQLTGRELGRGSEIDLDSLIGERYSVVVSGAQIVKVTPAAKE